MGEHVMMTRKNFEWIADRMGPLVNSPITIEMIADDLEKENPRFNREKFLSRAIAAWERKHLPQEIDDEIPY
jgi:hypothetical protein